MINKKILSNSIMVLLVLQSPLYLSTLIKQKIIYKYKTKVKKIHHFLVIISNSKTKIRIKIKVVLHFLEVINRRKMVYSITNQIIINSKIQGYFKRHHNKHCFKRMFKITSKFLKLIKIKKNKDNLQVYFQIIILDNKKIKI